MANESGAQTTEGTEIHNNHGQTPAAWTAVSIIMIAFVLGTIGVVIGSWPLFWVGGVALGIIGAITGRVMSMMGMGLKPKAS